ncbi:MAG: M56 family metallopeptidase [Saprospiraceae bacterium]|nr:M56 family metallopeptidase [Saprospiraceae bacterium]MCF8251832.1 M56 family metallopeptidase [Saprospiraceae bacterium]MCF8281959.1 M56 family metallopeptidase [Bacteroidales bacterium]MCF8313306.1 M56 family metallopeptidase [Saprospiraceae bacterium]MCF8441738.1 M56 family metallopeptidase [Saprospiraceae bacterium]
MNYLLEATFCWAVFYGIYHLLLRSETFHRTNRWYLLGTLLLGLVIPVLDIDLTVTEASPAYLLQPITVGVQQLETIVITASQREQGIDFQAIVLWIYWLGVVISLARFGYGLSQIERLYRHSEIAPSSGYRFVKTSAPHLPFSFFDNLFWSKNFVTTEEERRTIMRHEEAHIFQKHSHDVVLLELVAAFAWCVPFVYFYKKAVKTTHEYLADAHVTAGFDKKQYGRLLLRQSHPGMQVAISNSLFSSQLKKRIVMMTKTESSKRASWKYLAMLPAVAMLLLAFSFVEKTPTPTLLPDNQLFETGTDLVLTDTVPNGDAVFQTVEEMPRFPGCEDLAKTDERSQCAQQKMMAYLISHVKFPKEAKEKGFTGLVVAKFVVNMDGSIYDVDILKGGEGGTGEEVMRVIRAMPKWIPGKQDGKPVRTELKLPVRFALDGDPPKTEASKPLTLDDLDEMPVMAGCEDKTGDERKSCSNAKLMQAIFGNIKYPAEAREKGVQGMVVVKFIIEKDGSVTNPEIVKSVGSGCDEEVLRVVGQMPNWVPGKKDGKPVAVSFTLPVKFKLDGAEKKEGVLFEVYPNPASANGFDVKFKAPAGKVSIMFYDASKSGDVMEKTFPDYEGEVSTVHIGTKGLFSNGLSKGTVFVSLRDEKGNILGSTTVVVQ